MKFDLVVANPPYQDRTTRGKTPHKLWIEFAEKALHQWLSDGGTLLQISPASFQSPSSRVLALMRSYRTDLVDLTPGRFFPGIGSSFAYYSIRKSARKGTTLMRSSSAQFRMHLDSSILWLPADLSRESLRIHQAVMFKPGGKLDVRHDYVTCHNSLVRDGKTLSKTRTARHQYPVFHTNSQTWYSSVRQEWANSPKVMWSRSGYTKPFYDPGTLGGTDMAYYIPVRGEKEGKRLLSNLNHPVIRYILSTARWSGFGNEIVFQSLPAALSKKAMADREMDSYFGLSPKDSAYVRRYLGEHKNKAQ